jgi:hypothetical protein
MAAVAPSSLGVAVTINAGVGAAIVSLNSARKNTANAISSDPTKAIRHQVVSPEQIAGEDSIRDGAAIFLPPVAKLTRCSIDNKGPLQPSPTRPHRRRCQATASRSPRGLPQIS